LIGKTDHSNSQTVLLKSDVVKTFECTRRKEHAESMTVNVVNPCVWKVVIARILIDGAVIICIVNINDLTNKFVRICFRPRLIKKVAIVDHCIDIATIRNVPDLA
jgi:hypothetical protein